MLSLCDFYTKHIVSQCSESTMTDFLVKIQPTKLLTFTIQNHRELMGDRHQFIDIEVYRASPQRYTITECEHHKQEQLTEVCSKCHKIFCTKCDIRTGCKDKTGIYSVFLFL